VHPDAVIRAAVDADATRRTSGRSGAASDASSITNREPSWTTTAQRTLTPRPAAITPTGRLSALAERRMGISTTADEVGETDRPHTGQDEELPPRRQQRSFADHREPADGSIRSRSQGRRVHRLTRWRPPERRGLESLHRPRRRG
jgi:hypothetical protein